MSGNVIAGILVGLGVIAFAVFYYWKNYIPHSSSSHLNDGIDWFHVATGAVPHTMERKWTTPAGISIYGKNSDTVTDQMLADADAAYVERKEKAIRESEGTYTNFPPPTQIDIFIPSTGCVPSPVMKVESFLVKAGNDFEASIYDQHYNVAYDPPVERNGVLLYSEPDDCAVIYAAELLLSLATDGSSIPVGFTEPRNQWIVCPGEFWKEGCGNGWDHVIVAFNDGGYWAETNGPSHVHPIPFRVLPSAPSTAAMIRPVIHASQI